MANLSKDSYEEEEDLGGVSRKESNENFGVLKKQIEGARASITQNEHNERYVMTQN